ILNDFDSFQCKSMYFTKSYSPIVNVYSINGLIINMVTSKKDLGVIFCSDLNFHTHIEAFKTLSFVIRTPKNFKLTTSLKTLYWSLEYASVLWDPYTTADSSHLEQVQKRFLSSAANILGIQHNKHDCLPVSNKLGLISLVEFHSIIQTMVRIT
ncbi:putative RNA-directed DNA polymerase, partial [Aphis craccivora]